MATICAPSCPIAGADLVAWGELGLPDASLHERMLEGLRKFAGPVLFQLSSADLTGREFDAMWKRSRGWRKQMTRGNVTIEYLSDADHTFTTRRHLDEAIRLTLDWIRRL